MNEEDKIGKKIKERLEGHEFPVSGRLWETISAKLPPEIVSKASDMAAKKVAGSASTAHTSFIVSLTLIGVAAIVAIGLYLSSYPRKQTLTASPLPAKPLLSPTQQSTNKEKAFTDAGNKSKSSPKNHKKKSIPFVASNTNAPLKSTADKIRNKSESRSTINEHAVKNNPIYLQPKESLRDSIISAKGKKFEEKNQPISMPPADGRTNTESTLKERYSKRMNRKAQTTYDAKNKLALDTDSLPSEQEVNSNNENLEKSKNTLLTLQPTESTNLESNQPDRVSKSTARITAGILKIENYKNIEHTKEIADRLPTKFASKVEQQRFLEQQFSKANRETRVDKNESENIIIPTKSKRTLTIADLSVEALINTQYAFTTAKGDSISQDSATHLQARKAIVSAGMRINYHIPLRRSFKAASNITLSSGVLLERVQNASIYTHRQTTLDSTYTPVYEWHQSSGGDSIKVVVDTVLSTNINHKIRSFTQQQKVAYIGVPLTFSYNWHKNKWSFYITAGAQMNILLNTKTSMTSRDSLQIIPSLQGQQITYRGFVPLVVAHAGSRYRITEKLSFIIEPSFKYALQSIYKRPYALQPRLWIVGINTGIRYSF
ncbi:outer membrane beta-barrel protein [Rhodocytophaga aerolata]|uniref:Outer membrane beta-barrel protein n=1 Tax=Rhodocytophaga aerolata TaxID=455078 RepID=A0ABT8RKY3_9BACT|nr:outer membrane beta-barrel protein [Rhodocytophaga aerolata]MDO1451900.1 outer membrane beta-barrel protein [Rhodocytophaga aerolata]